MNTKVTVSREKNGLRRNLVKSAKRHWQFYILISVPVLYFIIFKYIPMFGVLIAFKDYNVIKGVLGSPWVGTKHFNLFIENPQVWTLIKNTFLLSLYQLAVSFPLPIILALALSEVRHGMFKKTVQMVTYAPYFISTVIIVSMLIMLLSPRLGVVNHILGAIGIPTINFMSEPSMFRSIYVWSEAWQNTGYAAVIYLAALAGIDPSLYEAARVDGASRLQKIINIDLPGILPTASIILILSVGSIMSVGFEKIYLMQNPINLSQSEVLATYVYKMGLLNANFSFATAVGLFNSVINLVLLVAVNKLSKRVTGSALW